MNRTLICDIVINAAIKVLHLWCMGLGYLFHTEPLPGTSGSSVSGTECLSEMEQFACGDIDATCEDVPPLSVGYD